MNCSDFELQLQLLAETRQVELPETATHHMASCAECRALWQDFRLLEAAIRSMERIEVPASIADSVFRELLPAPSHAGTVVQQVHRESDRAQGRSHWLIVIGAAASLLAAIGLGIVGHESPPHVARSSHTIESPRHVDVGPSVAEAIEDLKAEYQELAEETRATARDLAGVIPPHVITTVWATSPILSVEPNPAAQPNATDINSANAVSSIGRSFSDQIGQAFGFLRVAVPESVPRG